MDESLPYRISYSTGVEHCKKCQLRINNGFIQIAIMAQVRKMIKLFRFIDLNLNTSGNSINLFFTQSNHEDSKFPVWYHAECFVKIRLPPNEAAFDGFALLRYEHQMALRKELG